MKSYKKYICQLFVIAKEMGLIQKFYTYSSNGHYVMGAIRNSNRKYMLYRHRQKFKLHENRNPHWMPIIGEVSFRTERDLFFGRMKGTRSRRSIQFGIARMLSKMFVGKWNRLRFLWRATKLIK